MSGHGRRPAGRWTVLPPHPHRLQLASALGLSAVTAQILAHRGYDHPETADRFLRAPLDSLPDPLAVPDLARAAQVVWNAARGGRRIAVYGDFDTDGVCAVAVLVRGLRGLGVEVTPYVPHRLREGYGVSPEAVRSLAEAGVRCLVTVDCGVGAFAALELARDLGVQTVVVDHHAPPPALPPADVVVDPKLDDRPYPFRDYCATALAWLVVRAVRGLAGARRTEELLELVALATVADVVPLVGDNRVLARAGLERIPASPLPGLRELVRVAGVSGPVRADDVAWRLAPRLNAAGRVDSAGWSLRLLLTDDPGEAQHLAARLEAHNAHRQRLHEEALGAALAQVEELALGERPAVVVWAEGWHPGVVGLVAGRLREAYGRPAVALSVDGPRARGSARGVPGLDLVDALGDCAHLLDRFGGHAQAAGLELPSEWLQAFRERFERAVSDRLGPEAFVPTLTVEAEASLADLDERLVEELERLEPYGAGNPRPLVLVAGVEPLEVGSWGTSEHLWMRVWDGTRAVEAVGFGLGAWGELVAFARPTLQLAGFPERDRWRGGVRLVVEDLSAPEVDTERVLSDTGALLRRLRDRAEDYLADVYRGVELRPALYTKVVGVTFEGRQEVVAQLRPGEPLRLVREPANPHDAHAVRVVREDGTSVGYLSATVAGRLSPQMDRGARYRATVASVTGGGDRHLGVNVRLELEEDAERSQLRRVRRAFEACLDTDRLVRLVTGGRDLAEGPRRALRCVQEGGRALVASAPGKAWSDLVAAAAAACAVAGRRVVCVFPTCELAEARWEVWRRGLERAGLDPVRLHGLLPAWELAETQEVIRQGGGDAVFTTRASLALWPDVLDPGAVVVAEGWWSAELPEFLAQHPGPSLWVVWDPSARAPDGWEAFGDLTPRTGVRLVDHRQVEGREALVATWVREHARSVLFAAGGRSAVRWAERLASEGAVTYDHPGLPHRVRETLADLFGQGRLRCLVCGGEAPELLRGVDRAAWLAPTAADRFLQQAACVLDGSARVTLALAFGPADVEEARRAVWSRHPPKNVLAAVYRMLREVGQARWPEARLAAAVAEATGLDPTLLVPATVRTFEQAGLVCRERVGGGWSLTLLRVEGRRDLTHVPRFREGEASRAAFEAGAALLVRTPAVGVLERVASASVAARAGTGTG